MQDRRDPNRGRRAPADRRPGYRTDPRGASRPSRTGAGASSPLQDPTRRTVVKGLLGLGMGLGVFKLAQHQIFYRDVNMTRLEGRRLLTPTLYAKRGTLYDRNGNVLAASEECMNIALNTKQITDADAVVDALVDHLGVERSYAREKVGEDTTWTYVKMKVDTEVAEALLDEGLAGVEYEHAMKRVYPYGTLASQVLGVVGSDNVGISGLELQYEDELQGENGWMVRERAADGTYIAGGAYEKQDARDGSDLVLTLDINIQRAAEDALAEAVASSGANYGSVIVTDPATGDILAACSYPTYDPADLSTARTEDMNLRVVTERLRAPAACPRPWSAAWP